MEKLLDWIAGLPKAVQILLALTVISLLGFAVFWFAFGGKEEIPVVEQGQVLLEMPDASLEDKEMSRIETYRRDNMRSEMSASDFWNQLENGETGGLLVGPAPGSGENPAHGQGIGQGQGREEYLDPNIYSEIEMYYIRNGVKTKAEVDAEHAAEAREAAEEQAAEAARLKKQAEANSDSAYFARMEKAYQLAMKYSGTSDAGAAQEPEEEAKADDEVRRIDVPEPSYLPEEAMVGDGIITSLEQEQVGLVYDNGKTKVYPVRATFLKSERLVAGQRVVMRLKEDMRLKDGTVIPANTHVYGICKVGARLEIAVTTINYGGRIYRTDMSVYDNDGTEGIYCPVIEQKKGRKSAGKVAGQAATGLASTAATLFTGNPYLGRIASSSINELSKTTLSDGSVAINVVAGYDFYIFENVKRNG